MYETYHSLLMENALFANIQKKELEKVLQCIRPIVETYDKDEMIAIEGQSITGIYIVLSGEITVLKETEKGSRFIITKLQPSDFFGETAAYTSLQLWPASVMANKRSYVLRIPTKKLTQVCQQGCENHKMLVYNMLGILADKAYLLNQRLHYLSMSTLRLRLCHFFYDQYKKNKRLLFTLPYNRDEMAQYFGTTRPSLSRELAYMKKEGIIDFYKSSIKIKSLDGLIDEIT